MASHRTDKGAKAETIKEMAQFMIDNEPCTNDDLLRQFTKQEVETCASAARDEAHTQRNNRDAG